MRAVLFVSHRRPQVSVVSRTPAGWEQREYRQGESRTFPGDGEALTLAVDEIYAGVVLEDAP